MMRDIRLDNIYFDESHSSIIVLNKINVDGLKP